MFHLLPLELSQALLIFLEVFVKINLQEISRNLVNVTKKTIYNNRIYMHGNL